MNRRLFLIASLLSVAAAGTAYSYFIRGSNSAPGPSAAAPDTQRVRMVNGESVLTLSPEIQRASGIDTAPLAVPATGAEHTAYASVIDLQPFFDLAQRLATARAEQDIVQSQAQTSQAQYERVQALYQDEHNMSAKSAQEARVLALSDQARMRANAITRDALQASLRQQFGDALAQAATQQGATLFLQLSGAKAAVARVTSTTTERARFPERVMLDTPDGQRVTARKLSLSPQADPVLQGVSYLYLLERTVPVGTRSLIHFSTPENGPAADSVAIPSSAIVWYGGQRWSYLRTAPDRYTRRMVSSVVESSDGVIVIKGFHAGELVVTQGAQLLLSEEQRPQGIATQCKDPPECDD